MEGIQKMTGAAANRQKNCAAASRHFCCLPSVPAADLRKVLSAAALTRINIRTSACLFALRKSRKRPKAKHLTKTCFGIE
jgi:hypothetical protein